MIKKLLHKYLPRFIRSMWGDKYFYKWLQTKDDKYLQLYLYWTD